MTAVEGVIPSIITPFRPDLTLDEPSLENYVVDISSVPGITGILCAGITGEVSALSTEERIRITAICRDVLPASQKVFASVDAYSTAQAVTRGLELKQAGADVLQINCPFTHPLRRGFLSSPEAVLSFFEGIAGAVGLPMTIFQFPESTGYAYPIEVLIALAESPNVVGIKQAGDIERYVTDYDVLRGHLSLIADSNSYSLLPMLIRGADATMVGCSNVGTGLYCRLFESVRQGDLNEASRLMNGPLIRLMAAFTSDLGRASVSFVSRMKEALVMMGKIEFAGVRPPEAAVGEGGRKVIHSVLAELGLV